MIPLFTTEQVRKADEYAIKKLGIPGIALMENASVSIFDLIFEHFPQINDDEIIGIVAGKGNNGGDGFALARHLVNSGFQVEIISLASPKELKGDALINHNVFVNLSKSEKSGRIKYFKKLSDLNSLKKCTVIIDAILGTGTKGNIREPYASIIKKMNDLNAVKIAVDIPSGLEADNGSGDVIFEADLTITLAEFKRGLFFGKGYANAGEIAKGYIGIGPEFFENMYTEDYLIEPADAFNGLPAKHLDTHKYSAGKVLIIGGSKRYPGAAIFATNSSQKVGTGASVLVYPESMSGVTVSDLNSATLLIYMDEGRGFLSEDNIKEIRDKIDWADAIVLGPGLGREEETVKSVRNIIESNKQKHLVLDADALFAISNGEYKKYSLKRSILTPHHNEFSKLIGISVETLQQNLLKYGKKFVKETGCILVLKGAPTIIFAPDGRAIINSTGNPGMAKFGSGDVLSGVIAGLLSQNSTPESASITGVYLHSLSADLLLENKTIYGFTATDIMENLPNAIKHLIESNI